MENLVPPKNSFASSGIVKERLSPKLNEMPSSASGPVEVWGFSISFFLLVCPSGAVATRSISFETSKRSDQTRDAELPSMGTEIPPCISATVPVPEGQ